MARKTGRLRLQWGYPPSTHTSGKAARNIPTRAFRAAKGLSAGHRARPHPIDTTAHGLVAKMLYAGAIASAQRLAGVAAEAAGISQGGPESLGDLPSRQGV